MEGGQVMMGFDDNISKALQVTNRVTPELQIYLQIELQI